MVHTLERHPAPCTQRKHRSTQKRAPGSSLGNTGFKAGSSSPPLGGSDRKHVMLCRKTCSSLHYSPNIAIDNAEINVPAGPTKLDLQKQALGQIPPRGGSWSPVHRDGREKRPPRRSLRRSREGGAARGGADPVLSHA